MKIYIYVCGNVSSFRMCYESVLVTMRVSKVVILGLVNGLHTKVEGYWIVLRALLDIVDSLQQKRVECILGMHHHHHHWLTSIIITG